MIEPRPAAVMVGITDRMPRNVPTSFTRFTRRYSCNGVSAMSPRKIAPATFASTSTVPKRSTVVLTSAAQSSSLPTSQCAATARSPSSSASACARSSTMSATTTVAPSVDERPRRRRTDAARRAGHDRHLAVEPSHGSPLPGVVSASVAEFVERHRRAGAPDVGGVGASRPGSWRGGATRDRGRARPVPPRGRRWAPRPSTTRSPHRLPPASGSRPRRRARAGPCPTRPAGGRRRGSGRGRPT